MPEEIFDFYMEEENNDSETEEDIDYEGFPMEVDDDYLMMLDM